MKRSKHTLSNYRMITGNMGELMPFNIIPVLPGDTIQHHTSALVRVTPLNTPVMHPVSVRVHHMFCPYRLVWDQWEDFITGGDGGTPPAIPTIATTATKKSLLTYLGLPPIAGVDVSELPVRAVNKCFNEYYRDQDLVTERAEDDITVPQIAWEKDYFTAARPWSQKGSEVTLPMGGTADVVPTNPGTSRPEFEIPSTSDTGIYLRGDTGSDAYLGGTITKTPPAEQLVWDDPQLVADLAGATAASVNDVRLAFALQRYQEARARYGSRFTEYLRYLGVRPSDARLQRPEFLGGGSSRLNFSEVLKTAEDASPSGAQVGDMYGHGIAGVRSNRYRKFFEEHGVIVSFLSIRPKSIYMNGINREWLKTTKEDFFQKELANLGQQEVYEAELYAENTRDVFGYQDRYQEYRQQPSQVSQDFRDTLNAWHLARELSANPVLNASFVECSPSDRIFQVATSTADSLWIMANNHVVARRIVPKRANPRIF